MKHPSLSFGVPDARALALQLGAGRVVVAALMAAAPVPAARALGADTATAQRVTWLTRMMAVRDGALGVGALGATRARDGARPWVIGGAVSDALDAVVLGTAIRQGRLRGPLPRAIAAGAAAAAAVGTWAAARIGRS